MPPENLPPPVTTLKTESVLSQSATTATEKALQETLLKLNAQLTLLPLQRKNDNTTDCAQVPSSEHVAEIVGRDGCKIKSLRNKMQTYIKTPPRGEEPVFIISGKRLDVLLTKVEILSAAQHFTKVREDRKTNITVIPGWDQIKIRLPYHVVGLVVGPKGATIKSIQQKSSTYIATPSRDKEPVFTITGAPADVQRAKGLIQDHIERRTGINIEIIDEAELNIARDAFGVEGFLEYYNGTCGAAATDAASRYAIQRGNGTSRPSTPPNNFADLCRSAIGTLFDCKEQQLYSATCDQTIAYGSGASVDESLLDVLRVFHDASLYDRAIDTDAVSGSALKSNSSDKSESPPPVESVPAEIKYCRCCTVNQIDSSLIPCRHALLCCTCIAKVCNILFTLRCPICHSCIATYAYLYQPPAQPPPA